MTDYRPMSKEQAEKLAEAYKLLAEGKEIECRYNDENWFLWDGWGRDWHDFRIKAEPPLEFWATLASDGTITRYASQDSALRYAAAHPDLIARVFYLREVRDEDAQ